MLRNGFFAFIILIGTSLYMGQVSAYQFRPEFKPYIGAQYRFQHTKGEGDWTSLIPQSFHSGALIVGNRFHHNWGVEIGYYQQLKTSEHVDYSNIFFGTNAGGVTVSTATVKRRGFLLDFLGYLPLDPQFSGVGSVGVMSAKHDFSIKSTNGTNLATGFNSVTGKNAMFPRLGIGGEFIEKFYGVRGMVHWENTARLKINIDSMSGFPNTPDKPYKNGLSASLTVFYKFY